MTQDPLNEATRILREDPAGRDAAQAALLESVYDQLHELARKRMLRERDDHTLGATALVHEAWLKLVDRPDLAGCDHATFSAAAAVAMRRILVDHARAKATAKRPGAANRLPADAVELLDAEDPSLALELDDAIAALATEDPRAADVVRLRFYAGLEVTEAASVLGISARTAAREWVFARARLYQLLDLPGAAP